MGAKSYFGGCSVTLFVECFVSERFDVNQSVET